MAAVTTGSDAIIKALDLVPHPEAGYFREIYRSGSERPMGTRGQTDFEVSILTETQRNTRPDNDNRRNEMTSIYWMALKNQKRGNDGRLKLVKNLSDHVHYWHGGLPFEYTIINPTTGKVTRKTLGMDLNAGQVPQVCVPGGMWKCGEIVISSATKDDDDCYTLLGEGVAPGFDFYDFEWVTAASLESTVKDPLELKRLRSFIHDGPQEIVKESDKFYNKTI